MTKVKTNETKQDAVKTESIIDQLENHFSKYSLIYQIAFTIIALINSLLLFDTKLVNNDDALYLESAFKYAQNYFQYYHTANAPLYPMVIGIVVKFVGLNLVKIKLFSVCCFSASIFILFSALKNKIPYVILIPVIFLTAINAVYGYYGNLTFTEAFFSLIQSLFILVSLRFLTPLFNDLDIKKDIVKYLLIGFFIFLLSLTRSIAIVSIAPFLALFVLNKKYKNLALIIASFVLFTVSFNLIRSQLWKSTNQFTEQANLISYKDHSKPELGKEDLSGYINRFTQNSQIYLSNRFMEILNFRADGSETDEPVEPSMPITLLILALIAYSSWLAYKENNNNVLFTTIYAMAILFATFVALQTYWGQIRFVLVFMPFILISFFYLAYQLFHHKTKLGVLYIVIIAIFILTSVSKTNTAISNNAENLAEIKKGNYWASYTQDYQNYILMSKYCADSLPKNSFVAAKIGTMSFIFSGGSEFYSIYGGTVKPTADENIKILRDNKITHIMLAELRTQKEYVPNQYIGTVHRFVGIIQKQYPNCFKLVKVIGTEEPATLLEIDYANIDSMRASQNNVPSQPK